MIDADSGLGRADFYPGALEPPDASNAVYIMPHTLSCFNLLGYNQQRWQEAGLETPATAWTWNDAIRAAGQLATAESDGVQTYGLLLSPSQVTVLLRGQLAASGIDFESLNAEIPAIDSPEVSAAFGRIADLVAEGVLAPPALGQNSDGWLPLLEAQRAGIWSTDMTAQTGFSALDYSVGIARIGGDYPCTNLGYAASQGTRHPEAAYRWLAFLSRQGTNTTYSQSIGDIPARISVAEEVGYWARFDEASTAILTTVLDDYARSRRSAEYAILDPYQTVRFMRALDGAFEELG
ncbi:MAG: extracellular solute-binding protein, partial [Roseiflexaceae bacterium]|nr:extracellular solute-binding protein [Roseiflexaceae bacterium]